ncbi:unnamed protein product [Moneuplotes crassus]|uniref:Uncharacterized protein n=1 Tax=Euplotes crassus TaxID=5936 RepID=A0AAD1UBG9_EUPCR|nr:unnamed protein product [Moneuplotes crassus]
MSNHRVSQVKSTSKHPWLLRNSKYDKMRNTEKLWEKSVIRKMSHPSNTKTISHNKISNKEQKRQDSLCIENSKITKAIYEKEKEDSSVYQNPETRNLSMNSSNQALNKTDAQIIQDVMELKNHQHFEAVNNSKVDLELSQTMLQPMRNHRPIFDSLPYQNICMKNKNPYSDQLSQGLRKESKSIISKAKFVKSILGKSDDAVNTLYTQETPHERTVLKKRAPRSNTRNKATKPTKSKPKLPCLVIQKATI